MKRQRHRFKMIALFLFALFLLLGLYGVWSVTHYGSRWFSYAGNPRLAAQKENVVEGDILDRHGTVLAATEDGRRIFSSSPQARAAMVHVLGDRNGMIANSVETFQAGYLYGYQSSLSDAVHLLMTPSDVRKGNTVTLTLDAGLNTVLPGFFQLHPLSAGKNGAAVVMNYLTGEVLAMTSLPCFDPDTVTDADIASLDHPYWNRATQALYPPGSTFKIVTSAAAMKAIPDIQSQSFECTGALPVSEAFTVHDFNSVSHGILSLRDAFRRSCNCVYASLALKLGDDALRSAAESFGFNQNFLFRDLVVYNSSYPVSKRTFDAIAASGYGQSALTVTPVHMCLISAAVANGGTMPEPRLIRSVKTASGSQVLSFSTASARRVCSGEIASELSSMMKDVVQGGGSGNLADIPSLDIRGKTGTAESSLNGEKINYAWFTGFNAQPELPVAVCILVENIPDGETGGTVSAPVAKDVFMWLKNNISQVVSSDS